MPPIPKRLPEIVAKVLAELPNREVSTPPTTNFSATGANFGVAPAGSPDEPVYDAAARSQIQGNIFPGFRKDHQHFLFYKLGKKPAAKRWLKWLAPQLTTMDDALAFVRSLRALRGRLGTKDVPLKATWINVAFSHQAIATLVSQADADAFGDQSFRQGLAARSGFLGDPTDPKAEGNPEQWLVGGPKSEADCLVIVAADSADDLADYVERIQTQATADGLTLLFEQACATLPGALRGHEHFGFKDGISQPGLRGRTSNAATDFITPRYLDPTDPRAKMFAKPGQPLVWPGEFLLGEPRQNPENLTTQAAPNTRFPAWAARGSYVACRRLRQDVRAFWAFAGAQATALGMEAEKFASMLVGRWPSGAPIMRTPVENAALGADEYANNHFLFDDNTRPSQLQPIHGYPGDHFTQAQADVLGLVCPHFAHIRKVNPRDSTTDLGKPSDTLIRMLLRRGITFGPPVVGVKNPTPALWKKERGLMFVSYQGSIEDQFEFLLRRWSNSSIQPNFGGHDPVIGQREQYGNRDRVIDFPHNGTTTRITLTNDWITPTGGGYFFAPPIDAVANVLGG